MARPLGEEDASQKSSSPLSDKQRFGVGVFLDLPTT